MLLNRNDGEIGPYGEKPIHDRAGLRYVLVMYLLTNILGPILPDIINSFHVNLTVAGFLAFAFFIAYDVLSVPAGFLMEHFTRNYFFAPTPPPDRHSAE